jgi:hypothetical protein
LAFNNNSLDFYIYGRGIGDGNVSFEAANIFLASYVENQTTSYVHFDNNSRNRLMELNTDVSAILNIYKQKHMPSKNKLQF